MDEITYAWSPENPISGATFNTIGAGTYTVIAYNDEGCIDSLEIEITQLDSIWAELTTIDNACHGDSTGIAEIE